MMPWLPILITLIYFIAGMMFYKTSRGKLNVLWALATLFIACQMHIILLIYEVGESNGSVLNLSVFNVMSIYAWTVAYVSLLWLWKAPMALGGVMISFINALLVLTSVVFLSHKPFLKNMDAGMIWHILLSIAAWTVLSIASIHALLYSYLFQKLKKKRLYGMNVVALANLERLMGFYISIGLVLLLGALISGWLFVENLFSQHLWHKTVLTMLSAIVYVWTVYLFIIRQTRGMRIVLWALLGYGLLLVGYMISNIVLQFIINP